jgi:hypothetical protein
MTTGHIVVFTIGVIKTKKRYIIKHGWKLDWQNDCSWHVVVVFRCSRKHQHRSFRWM